MSDATLKCEETTGHKPRDEAPLCKYCGGARAPAMGTAPFCHLFLLLFFSYIKLPTYSLVSIRRFMVYSTRSILTKEVGRLFITPCPPARSRKLFTGPSWCLARKCEFCFYKLGDFVKSSGLRKMDKRWIVCSL